MWCDLYFYLHCSTFVNYLVTHMTPSLYLLLDIALFTNQYTVYLHVYKPPVLID